MGRFKTLMTSIVLVLAGVATMGANCATEPSEFHTIGDDDDTPGLSGESVIITEIMANPNRVPDPDGEWFEIFNAGSSEIDLADWTISDGDGNSFTVEELTLSAQDYAVFGLNGLTEDNGGVSIDYEYDSEFTLGNNGETLTIHDANAALVDTVSFESAPDGASLSLDPAKYDADLNDLSDSFCATRFSELPEGDFGTPGSLNDVCWLQASAGDLVITEIMANPLSEYDYRGKYFEVYNTTSSAIKMDGWTLKDGAGDEHTISSSGEFQVEAKSYAVLGAHYETSENGGVSVDYSFAKDLVFDGSSQTFSIYADSTLVDEVDFGQSAFPSSTEGVSLQLDPSSYDPNENDDGANWCDSTTELGTAQLGTPGDANESCS